MPSKNKVKVAVTDTGLNFQHEDLKNRIEGTGLNYVEGEDFTDNRGHGTIVTSILNAETNNTIGIAGNSGISDVTAVPYKIGNKDGNSKSSILASAIIDICKRDDIKIISASYGVGHSKVLSEAVQLAENKGILIVAAAGNNNTKVNYPAAYSTVIAAGAVNKDNTRCVPGDWKGDLDAGCCFGPELNLMAPGNGIVAADKSGKYTISGGTSSSTPMIAAAAAIMLGQNENLTPSEIRQILYSTALDLGDPGKDDYYGYGLTSSSQSSGIYQL